MTNIGKRRIVITYLHHHEPETYEEFYRTVYEKTDGTMWIRYRGKKLIVRGMMDGNIGCFVRPPPLPVPLCMDC